MKKPAGRAVRMLFHNKGSSLLEMMVVCGIMGIVMLGVASQITFSARSTNAIEKDLAFLDLVQQLERVAASNNVCSASLTGTTPVNNGPVSISYAGLSLAPGTLYQNGAIKITKLEWALVSPVSPTNALGYLTVQADLAGSTTSSVVGGNMRNFPKPGSTPPGILIDLQISPVTGKITSCGPPTAGIDYYWSFTSGCYWGGGNLYSCGSTTTLPTPAMPDTNYLVNCNTTSIATSSGKHPSGAVTVTALYPTGFDYIVTTIMSNGQHSGQDQVGINCHAHHP
jgi:type II secretory pathway pseudopilin PulG